MNKPMISPSKLSACITQCPQPFPYPPLPPSTDALRILTLSPGAFTDPLTGTLTAAPFASKPRYAALSYTWGPSHPDLDAVIQILNVPLAITINEHSFPIHANLFLALLHLRSKTHPLPIWIDAICINQSSLPERNTQVAMMGFIYSRAQTVVAWVGIREINLSASGAEPLKILARERQDGVVEDLAAALAERRKVSKTSKEPSNNTFDFARIAESGYWKRLWIVQEVCLARELVLVFGGKMWRFEEVAGWDMLERARAGVGKEMVNVLEARAGRHGEGMRFENLVERFMEMGCQEDRDRVFGLLGLATDVRAGAEDRDRDDDVKDHLESFGLREDCGDGGFKRKRGTGAIRVDYSRKYYDIWAEAIEAVFFRVRPMSSRFEDSTLSSHEREASIVRTAGIVQAALRGNVEFEVSSTGGTAATQSPMIIKAMGYLAGEITELGPGYSALVGSFRAQQGWLNTCEMAYDDSNDLETIRALNEAYSTRLLAFGNEELHRIREIQSPSVIAWHGEKDCLQPARVELEQMYERLWGGLRQRRMQGATNNGPGEHRICIGTEHVIALVPPSTAVGDVIVRFWGCDAALVMRPAGCINEPLDGESAGVPFFLLVGRADVAGKTADAKRFPADKTSEDKTLVWVHLGLEVLQMLTASIAASSR
ncbi:heterokaryon incompatibility protein-domain-containing protein [Podospora aff. communis PSN243]|uniref:Heterokaryon incompatibility protein-domain-containing protein n=1 Tax=Podospora aff. communis PSN243 TaxID=3040156 RepID=A0AAV9GM41_9PEZI|nr:heterokaryon incompatibility protein-domain-containing protein [Podospora aff. communis PSN243]